MQVDFPLRIGEQATITNPETGEPVRVCVVAGEEGRLTVIVEALPGSTVQLTAPANADVVYEYKAPDARKLH